MHILKIKNCHSTRQLDQLSWSGWQPNKLKTLKFFIKATFTYIHIHKKNYLSNSHTRKNFKTKKKTRIFHQNKQKFNLILKKHIKKKNNFHMIKL